MVINILILIFLETFIWKETSAAIQVTSAHISGFDTGHFDNSLSSISIEPAWPSPVPKLPLVLYLRRELTVDAKFKVEVYLKKFGDEKRIRTVHKKTVKIFVESNDRHRLPDFAKKLFNLGASNTGGRREFADAGVYDFDPFIVATDLEDNYYFEILNYILDDDTMVVSFDLMGTYVSTSR